MIGIFLFTQGGANKKHILLRKDKLLHASRLPPWCFVENKIPELYQKVLETVTQNGGLDTSLLYPILVSSGLHHDTLGHIWGLVNLTTPGQLMPHELNAALALVALAQNGCKFSGLEVLRSVPQSPIPFLQHPSLCPSQREGRREAPTTKSPGSSQTQLTSELQKEPVTETEQSDEFADFLSAPPVNAAALAASAESPSKNAHCGSSAVGSRLANYNTVASTQPSADGVSAPELPNVSQVNLQDDDFADFQHAENILSDSCAKKELTTDDNSIQVLGSEPIVDPVTSGSLCVASSVSAKQSFPLNNCARQSDVPEEDRYAVFRELESAREDGQQTLSQDDEYSTLYPVVTDAQPSVDNMSSNSSSVEQDVRCAFSDREQPHAKQMSDSFEDEFGEFISVSSASPVPSAVVSSVSSLNCTHNSSLVNPLSSVAHTSLMWTTLPTDAGSESSYQSVISPEFQLLQFQSGQMELHNASESTGSTFPSVAQEPTDADEFGDFMSPGDLPVDGDSSSLNNQSLFSKDTGSVESQSISSFELGATDGFAVGSDLSRHGSVPSLDLKVMPETDDDFGDLQSGSSGSVLPTCNGYVGSKPSDGFAASNSPSRESQSKTVFPIVDRYSFVRSDAATTQSDLEKNVVEWEHCLESCYRLIQGANDVFSNISSSTICKEILNSEEGKDYLKNIVEVFKLVHRVRLSIKTMAFENEAIQKLLRQIDLVWSNFSIFISPSPYMPEIDALDYSAHILKPEPENNYRACGVCLLDVGTPSLAQPDSNTLLYGGRQYHATCANFWVNCVNQLLPALTLQQLL